MNLSDNLAGRAPATSCQRIAASSVPAVKTSPPAVAIGPPSAIDPHSRASGAVSVPGNWPSGVRHAISPVPALTAVRMPHGGGVHGRSVFGPSNSRRASPYGVPRWGVLKVATELPRLLSCGHVVSRDQPDFGCDFVHRHDQQVVHSVVSDPAPRHPAHVSRNDECSPERRRREEAVGTQRAHSLSTPRAILIGQPPGVVPAEKSVVVASVDLVGGAEYAGPRSCPS